MKEEIDLIGFGRRVRQLREDLGLSQKALGKRAGYSATNIGWLEQGNAKDPRTQAEDLAGPLHTTAIWLLWERGPKRVGRPIMTTQEMADGYDSLSPEDREDITEEISKRMATKKKRKNR